MTPAYLRAARLDDAVAALAEAPRAVLAGGTDFYPALVGRAVRTPVLDIAAIDELRGIHRDDTGLRIGALATWSEIADASLAPAFDGLRAAARSIGGRQIQNVATLGGNLCNASPAADGIPNLMVLDATVELRSARGTRRLALTDFVLGNRETARAEDELLCAIHVPTPPRGARSAFLKLGARSYLVISMVMVAALVALDPRGRIDTARICIGACSPVAPRLAALEAALTGRLPAEAMPLTADPAMYADLAPIDDPRASAEYRLDAARTLTARALAAVTEPRP